MARTKYRLSERCACRIVGQPRGTQRYGVIARADEDALTGAILELAAQYGRYGYRRITVLSSSRRAFAVSTLASIAFSASGVGRG